MSDMKGDAIQRMAALQRALRTKPKSPASLLAPNTMSSDATIDKNSARIVTGRGSTSGWTTCPLCNPHPRKQKQQIRRYALGRGIASHLHAIHTPWLKPKSQKRKVMSTSFDRRVEPRTKSLLTTCEEEQEEVSKPLPLSNKRQKREVTVASFSSATSVASLPVNETCQEVNMNNSASGTNDFLWVPTNEEMETWNAQVLQIVTNLEHTIVDENQSQVVPDGLETTPDNTAPPSFNVLPPGYDRNGKLLVPSSNETSRSSSSYQTNLPQFIKAASDGDLQKLTDMIQEQVNAAVESATDHGTRVIREQAAIEKLIHTRDRHGSIAEHWAAGGGHLQCLQYLIQLRRQNVQNTESTTTGNTTRRRRDGKTCLHYAARNGHRACIKYIIDEDIYPVDVTSNDGTTPLHMACYGGHIEVIWYLIERYRANVHYANDYGCTMVHWIGLSPTLNDQADQGGRVVELLSRLCDMYGISLFLVSQKHGHTILHKAAQKLNQPIIEYFLNMKHLTTEQSKAIGGIADTNGHTVSTIWRSFGGNEAFSQRMQSLRSW